MNVVLSFCLFRRTDYTQQIMQAAASISEFADLPSVASVDYSDAATQDCVATIAAEFFPKSNIIKHKSRVGCNVNTRMALTAAMGSGADFVIHIEDDILLSPDAGQWFLWAANRFQDDKTIRTVTAWRHSEGWLPGREKLEGEELHAKKQSFFCCWGWGTWADRLPEMLASWTTDTQDTHEGSWDVAVEKSRSNRHEVAPMISRAQNIGRHLGTHRGDCILPAWQTDKTSGQYTLVD